MKNQQEDINIRKGLNKKNFKERKVEVNRRGKNEIKKWKKEGTKTRNKQRRKREQKGSKR